MSGEPEKILRASFCGAANHLTQLYMVSLKQEKMAYKRGYCHGLESVIRSLQQLQGRSPAVSIDALLELLQNKKREVAATLEDVTGEPGEEEEENKDPRQNEQTNNQGFNTVASTPQTPFVSSISSPFQQPTNRLPTSFGQTSTTPLPAQPQFTFGTAPPQPQSSLSAFSSVSNATASTFTQAVSNSIPFPTLPFQPQQPGLGSPAGRNNGSRKRQFFEYLFDSSPAPQSNPSATSDYLSSFFSSQQQQNTSTTTTASTTSGNESENGNMDFSSYPANAVWKRSRIDEPLTIQNNG